MTTVTDGVAVIATQVAQTDRRALSEAWYSALHLAHADEFRYIADAAPQPLFRPGAAGGEQGGQGGQGEK